MRVYRILWRSAVCLLAVTGVVIAFVVLSWQPLLGLSLLAAILGPLFGAGLHAQTRGTTAPLRYMLAVDACAVIGAIAMAGFIAFLGAIALLGVGLLILSCPEVLRLLLPRRAPQAPVPDAPSAAPPPPAPPRLPITLPPLACDRLSDSELCWRWRTSFTALQHTVSPGQRMHLIETRAALLDELARRNPEGFSRWLNNGARAASDPARYLGSTHHSPPLPHQQRRETDL